MTLVQSRPGCEPEIGHERRCRRPWHGWQRRRWRHVTCLLRRKTNRHDGGVVRCTVERWNSRLRDERPDELAPGHRSATDIGGDQRAIRLRTCALPGVPDQVEQRSRAIEGGFDRIGSNRVPERCFPRNALMVGGSLTTTPTAAPPSMELTGMDWPASSSRKLRVDAALLVADGSADIFAAFFANFFAYGFADLFVGTVLSLDVVSNGGRVFKCLPPAIASPKVATSPSGWGLYHNISRPEPQHPGQDTQARATPATPCRCTASRDVGDGGHFRTSMRARGRSALPPGTDIISATGQVRFVPRADPLH